LVRDCTEARAGDPSGLLPVDCSRIYNCTRCRIPGRTPATIGVRALHRRDSVVDHEDKARPLGGDAERGHLRGAAEGPVAPIGRHHGGRDDQGVGSTKSLIDGCTLPEGHKKESKIVLTEPIHSTSMCSSSQITKNRGG
jgi:hypothetical protein